MLKFFICIGGLAVVVLAIGNRGFREFAAWLIALTVVLTITAIEALPLLLPLLPKVLSFGLLTALENLHMGRSAMKDGIREGAVVLIKAFDDIPQHRFWVTEVYEDCVGGYSLEGPLEGAYGEPDYDLILAVVGRQTAFHV